MRPAQRHPGGAAGVRGRVGFGETVTRRARALPAFSAFVCSRANAPVRPSGGGGRERQGRRWRLTRHCGRRSGLKRRSVHSRIWPAFFPAVTRAQERGAAGLPRSAAGAGRGEGARTGKNANRKRHAPLGALHPCACDVINRETQSAGHRAGRTVSPSGTVASSSGHRHLSASAARAPAPVGAAEAPSRRAVPAGFRGVSAPAPPAAWGGLGRPEGWPWGHTACTRCGARLLCALPSAWWSPPSHAALRAGASTCTGRPCA